MQIKRNPYPHEECHSTRRAGVCVGVTRFWVCQQVIDWLKEDGKLGVTELQRRLKDSHKILVAQRRVCPGKQLAMHQQKKTSARINCNSYVMRRHFHLPCLVLVALSLFCSFMQWTCNLRRFGLDAQSFCDGNQ